jgi:uncharacterized protein
MNFGSAALRVTIRTFFALLMIGLAAPLVAEATDGRQIINAFTLTSKTLGEDRQILVRVPPDYLRGTARYPVLYMTDGDAQMLHTVGTVQFLAGVGRMPEMIVVGIVQSNRSRELTPTHWKHFLSSGEEEYPTSGGGEQFLDFIEKELIPWVEASYRTEPFRIFAGHSLGGLLAVHAFVSRPNLFNATIAASPTLWWEDQLEIRKARDLFRDSREMKRTLFVTVGDEAAPIVDGVHALESLLKSSRVKGLRWRVVEMNDEDHGSIVLRAHYSGLRFIFEQWRMPRAKSGEIPGGLAGVRQHYRGLSEDFGYEVPIPEALLNQLGYQLMGQQKLGEAIDAFKENASRHPSSPNVHDSLGEALEHIGENDAALESYSKATELARQTSDPNAPIFASHYERLAARTHKKNE